MPDRRDRVSLVADVGGTNTRVALAEGRALREMSVRKFRNSEFEDLESLLLRFEDDVGLVCDAAAVAIAGPVHDGRGTLTNLDWSVEPETLSSVTGAQTVSVLNDLQAQAHALQTIPHVHLAPVIEVDPEETCSRRLVVGIGTGFNSALAIPNGPALMATPSECGHARLPAGNSEELGLVEFITASVGFASVEDALSGRGIENIHAWHASMCGKSGAWSATDVLTGIKNGDDLAMRTLDTFVRILGSVCGDLALIHLPFGGIYLVGGMARAVAPYLQDFGFVECFLSKGRFSGFMEQFPVCVVEDDFAALSGLAVHLDDLRSR
ncbi:MAG: glucokinase [Boseongicola sp. SB0664_bin_43]|uniref:Glucokinase n=1 Tax=Boseongicola sp. SB0664_bin_43 TaxID=2604844 RepID=A0A6B0Y2G4_9RHOB|nr:glucokinase [Boseongicola sp. SB0664_bin_43]